jgi:hypothetical protein
MNYRRILLSGLLSAGFLCSITAIAQNNLRSQVPLYANGAVFSWDGKTLEGLIKSNKVFPVKAGAIIKANVCWRNLISSPGSDMMAGLIFESADGAPVDNANGGASTPWDFASGGIGTLIDNCPVQLMTKQYPRPEARDIMEAEAYFTAPPGVAQARLAFLFKGNPSSIQLVGDNIEKVSAMPKEKPERYPAIKHDGKMLTDAELDKVLADSEILRAELKTTGDMVSMYVNGKRTAANIYKTSAWARDASFDMSQTFYRAGFNVFTTKVSLGLISFGGGPGEVWQGHKRYDISKIREAIRRVLKRAPDAMVMLELVVTPCRGWGKNNPGEIFQHSDGSKGVFRGGRIVKLTNEPPKESNSSPEFWHPSYYSEKYNVETAEAIYDVFSQIESTPEGKRVIGVYLSGGTDGQWLDLFNGCVPKITLSADYSPAALNAFRNYLKVKYNGDITKLQAAWKDGAAKSFEEIKIPQPEELWRGNEDFHSRYGSCKTSDYCEFLGYGNAMRHIKWCKAVKDATKGRWLAGGYCPNSGLCGYPILAQQDLEYLLKSKDVDFFTVVPMYSREFYNPVIQAAFNGSLLLHDKLLVAELDLRNPEVGNWGMWGSEFWRRMHNADTYRNEVEKFVAYSISRGGTFHAYDMNGGWFNTPNAIDAWKQGCRISDLAVPGRLDAKRIAVAASERFWDFQSFDEHGRLLVYSVRELPQHALARSGVRHDYYLLSDVLENKSFEAPKVLMFTDACTMTPAQAATIREKFGNSGRVLVWFWAPGIFADGDERNHSKISGFKLEPAESADGKPIFVSNQNDPLLCGVKGFLFPDFPSYGLKFGSAWKVADPEAKVLANYFGTDIPAMAVKRHKGFTEIYIGQPGSLTPQLIRNIALAAGITPLVDTDDLTGYGGNILYLAALASGVKTIHLPDGAGTVECLTGQQIKQNGNTVAADIPIGATFILRLNSKP